MNRVAQIIEGVLILACVLCIGVNLEEAQGSEKKIDKTSHEEMLAYQLIDHYNLS